jgi:hypothetical protein
MPKIDNTKKKYENKHRTFNDPIAKLYSLFNTSGSKQFAYNAMTQEVMDLIAEAQASNTTLRALGSGWSWHQIMTGGPKGIMLDTKPLNLLFNVNDTDIATANANEAKYLKFAQCGTGIWELNRTLKDENLSLKTTGASNGQTIAGLIGTGAHGSAMDVGAAQDFVLGLHIIVGASRHVYLERSSQSIVNQTFVDKLGAEWVKDDDLFNAALVSFGSFGFIHGVMVQVEDIFLLEGCMRMDDFDNDVLKLMESNDFGNTGTVNLLEPNVRPYHFEVKLNPYDPLQQVYVTTFAKRPYHSAYTAPVANAGGIGPGDDAPAFIGKVLAKLPKAVPKAINALTKSSLTPYENATGTIGEIFNNTALRGKLLSAAIGIQPHDIKRVIQILADVNSEPDVFNFPGIYAFRFVKGTKATLGFTRFPITCVLEMDGAFNDRAIAFCERVWDRLQTEGIAYSCHWGKQVKLNAARIRYMYGQAAVDSWLAARNSLLDTASKQVFTNPIMLEWGLG